MFCFTKTEGVILLARAIDANLAMTSSTVKSVSKTTLSTYETKCLLRLKASLTAMWLA